VLRYVPQIADPRVLADAATRDDAAVLKISEDRAIVATVDFFAPIVDDPYAFGLIAGANSLSDIYAMGATPLLALNIVAWPRRPDLFQFLPDVLRGGADVVQEAGALLLGGHSVEDDEPKYGMVVVGEVAPEKLIHNAGAKAGDVLVLTKPIGTGILSTALKRARLEEDDLEEAVQVMATLNAAAADAMRANSPHVHAATDVTGFGLVGHLHNMLKASGVSARIDVESVPVMDIVMQLISEGVVPGGTERNAASADSFTDWGNATPDQRLLLADAQTSGGLLVSVAPDSVDSFLNSCNDRNVLVAAVVGEVLEGPAGHIIVNA